MSYKSPDADDFFFVCDVLASQGLAVLDAMCPSCEKHPLIVFSPTDGSSEEYRGCVNCDGMHLWPRMEDLDDDMCRECQHCGKCSTHDCGNCGICEECGEEIVEEDGSCDCVFEITFEPEFDINDKGETDENPDTN